MKMTVKSNTSDHFEIKSSSTKLASIAPMRLWLLQVFTLALVISQFPFSVYGNSHEMIDEVALIQGNNEPPTDESTAQLLDEVKRSWQSLQGSWGKRDQGALVGAAPETEDYDVQIPEWSPTGVNEFNDHPEMMKYSVIYASSPNALAAAVAAAASASTNNGDVIGEEGDTPSGFEKKSWKNMNVAWGKRRSAVWNKFRGAWGKREPGWNNLKGMWGKRSSGDWRKLQSAWGKRSLQH